MNQSGGPYGRQGRSAQPGLFGGFNPVPPPREVFDVWKDIWSATSAVLLSSANNLRLGVQWFATHATAGKPTPQVQQTMELSVTKKEACLGLAYSTTRQVWREMAPVILHARETAPNTDRASQRRVLDSS